jgi:hypothetical protein
MQIGIGGAAGDEYDALRHFLSDPGAATLRPPCSWRRWS